VYARISRLCLLLLALPYAAARADAANPYFELHQVGKGVWAAIVKHHSEGGGNSGFVVGSDSVLVIDTFAKREAAELLLAEIRKVTDKPVRYVVNTHYHGDHLTGNGVFAEQGAVIMAQRNVRTWERTENTRVFFGTPTPEFLEEMSTLTLPTLTYQDGVEVYLGDRRVVVRVMPGHTGSDSVVIVPDAKVVFTGDLFWYHALPNLVDANTAQQIASDGTLADEYPDATFVPGHWELATAGDLRAFRGYLVDLRQAVAAAQAAGKSGQGLVDEVKPVLKRKYADWLGFDFFLPLNVAQTAAELDGTKQLPVPAAL